MAKTTFNMDSSSTAEKNLVRDARLAQSGKGEKSFPATGSNGSSPEQAAEILSLSMPANAQYPECFFDVLSTFGEKILTTIVSNPGTAREFIIAEIQRENRRKWKKSGKPPANRGLDAEAQEAIAARRRWFSQQLSLLLPWNVERP